MNKYLESTALILSYQDIKSVVYYHILGLICILNQVINVLVSIYSFGLMYIFTTIF